MFPVRQTLNFFISFDSGTKRKCFLENQFFEKFGKCLEKSSNSRSKNRDQKSGGQIPAEKGSAKKPSQVLLKIDTNFKTTTRRAKARRPVFGLLFWNLNRFFVGLCLAFWLAGFFAGLCFGMAFSVDFWPRPKKHFPKLSYSYTFGITVTNFHRLLTAGERHVREKKLGYVPPLTNAAKFCIV